MIAVDTNVVVRLLTADDPDQTQKAKGLFAKERIYVSRTVLLEVAWVLRATYGLSPNAVIDSITKLAGLDSVVLEERERVLDALTLGKEKMDMADALHVTATPDQVVFVTFDRGLAEMAERSSVLGVAVRELD